MLNHIFMYVFVTSSNLILDYKANGKLATPNNGVKLKKP